MQNGLVSTTRRGGVTVPITKPSAPVAGIGTSPAGQTEAAGGGAAVAAEVAVGVTVEIGGGVGEAVVAATGGGLALTSLQLAASSSHPAKRATFIARSSDRAQAGGASFQWSTGTSGAHPSAPSLPSRAAVSPDANPAP